MKQSLRGINRNFLVAIGILTACLGAGARPASADPVADKLRAELVATFTALISNDDDSEVSVVVAQSEPYGLSSGLSDVFPKDDTKGPPSKVIAELLSGQNLRFFVVNRALWGPELDRVVMVHSSEPESEGLHEEGAGTVFVEKVPNFAERRSWLLCVRPGKRVLSATAPTNDWLASSHQNGKLSARNWLQLLDGYSVFRIDLPLTGSLSADRDIVVLHDLLGRISPPSTSPEFPAALADELALLKRAADDHFRNISPFDAAALRSRVTTDAGSAILDALEKRLSPAPVTPIATSTPSGEVPVISGRSRVKATYARRFNYRIRATNSPTDFSMEGELPRGLVLHQLEGAITGVPKQRGRFTVDLFATNESGRSRGSRLVIRVKKKPRASAKRRSPR